MTSGNLAEGLESRCVSTRPCIYDSQAVPAGVVPRSRVVSGVALLKAKIRARRLKSRIQLDPIDRSSVSKIAIAFPYDRTVVGHFYTRNGLIFRIPSVYYARDFTRAVNLYAHV